MVRAFQTIDQPCRCIQHRLQPVYQVGRMPTSTLLMLSLPLHESLVISQLIISLTFVHNKEVLVLVLRSQVLDLGLAGDIPCWRKGVVRQLQGTGG